MNEVRIKNIINNKEFEANLIIEPFCPECGSGENIEVKKLLHKDIGNGNGVSFWFVCSVHSQTEPFCGSQGGAF